ncbi:PRC-barrel domain-containing protein [Azospirillum brasilense]|uniref:PRC-barrel domain-containing protein n=1 Tax=Azospirillum brasilense TaxID=192 RepID=UPI000E0B31BA|nr:PRC-barrel domain-containing protein [Azospirillum brasilense]
MKTIITACGVAALLLATPAMAESMSGTAKEVPNNKATGQVAATHGSLDPAVAKMTAAQLKGKDVYGSDGKDIAEIEGIVRKGGQTFAVIDVDHIADISDKDVVLPLERLHMKDKRLTVDMTENELKGLESWQKGKYEDVKGALR